MPRFVARYKIRGLGFLCSSCPVRTFAPVVSINARMGRAAGG